MTSTVKVVVYGAAGRMGQAVVRAALESPWAELACALVRPGSELAGEPLQRVFGALSREQRFSSSLAADVTCDVLVDFSGPLAFDSALALAMERRMAFVSGTTGLSDAQRAALARTAEYIPVLWAANFSLGMAVLMQAARRVAEMLPDWDCEIVELHHARKPDAPSGTALALGEAVALARGSVLAERARFVRHGTPGPRRPGEIGFAAVRGGDVIGEHTVFFASTGERLEFTHRVGSRDIFARGALAAAVWLAQRPPGLYTFEQVLAAAS
jgi:4-hydroxy-tetrahydrodipicolinate reductase